MLFLSSVCAGDIIVGCTAADIANELQHLTAMPFTVNRDVEYINTTYNVTEIQEVIISPGM